MHESVNRTSDTHWDTLWWLLGIMESPRRPGIDMGEILLRKTPILPGLVTGIYKLKKFYSLQ